MTRKAKIWLTSKQIRQAGACRGFISRFRRRFPTGRMEVTVANAEKYYRFFKGRVMFKPYAFLSIENADMLKAYSEKLREHRKGIGEFSWNDAPLSSPNAIAMAEATAFARLYIKQYRR